MSLKVVESRHMRDLQIEILENSIVIRPEDLNLHTSAASDDLIVIAPEDIDAFASAEDRTPIVIRLEDLPVVPYHGAVPPELIQVFLPPDELRALERRMLDLINADRAAHFEESGGAGPLEWDDTVAAVARAHSEDMVAQRYIGHVNRAGLGPQDRLRQAGIWFLACGENIAGTPTMRVYAGHPAIEQVYTGYPTIEAAEEGLMNSPDHRKNILNRWFTHVGVGIARNPDGTFVITQNFITRPPVVNQLLDWGRRR